MGTPIVFGSPEAAQIIKRDRETFGPRDAEDGSSVMHHWELTVEGTASVLRTYHFDAFSKEAALTQWDHGKSGDWDDEQVLDFDVDRYEVTDLGEVES